MTTFTPLERRSLTAALDRTYHPCHVDHDHEAAPLPDCDGWSPAEMRALDTLVVKVQRATVEGGTDGP